MTNTEQANSIGFQSAEQLGMSLLVLDRWAEEGRLQRMTLGRLKFFEAAKAKKIHAEQKPTADLVEVVSLAGEIDASRWTVTGWCAYGKIKSAKKLRSPKTGHLVWYADRDEVVRYAAGKAQRIADRTAEFASSFGGKPAEGVVPRLDRIEAKLDALLAELGVALDTAPRGEKASGR